MKTLLNLLPEEKKEIIQNKLRFRFLLWQLFLIFLLEIFYLSVLVGMYLILDFELQSLEKISNSSQSSYTQEKKLAEYEKKFRDVNTQTDIIGKIERSHLHFTNVFLLLDTLLPKGITVSGLSTKEYTVSISGKAQKREDLLLLDGQLKGSSCITNVNIPLTNLFSQENIDFQLDFQVSSECLQKNSL